MADLTEVPPPSGGPNELGTGSAIGNLDEPLAAQVHFRGEESARFVAFAHLCIAANIGAEVRLEGFEPASNRRVALRGTVQDAHQEGYVRTLTVRSDDALLYSIGGNNATLEDIACEQITFIMGLDQFVRLQERADSGQHVPGVKSNTVAGKRWLDLEDLLSGARSVEDIRALVRLIGNSDGEMSRGASRSLRSFHRELIRDRALSLEIEAEAIECLRSSEDLDTRVALLESIGYFGSHAGRQVCADIVSDRSRHAHERWAAVVSLSRLGAGNKIAVLDAACGDEDLQVRTAAALGRAQQLEPIGRRTERVLVKSLLKEDDEVPRHVCAALARLHSPRGATLKGLVAVAISDHSTLIQAGSVASCLVGWLPRVSAGGRRRLRLRLEAFINSVRTPCESPSEIWALEYLAELSSALGAFDLSRKYFELCSQSCSDWKASYYAALACYESGEEYRVKGRRSLSLEEFTRSAKLLSSLQGGDPLTVAFRADVVAARIRIARASMLIPADADTSQIERAIDELLAARSLYARYMRRDEPAINRIVIRERRYLRDAYSQIGPFVRLLRLDLKLRSSEEVTDSDIWRTLLLARSDFEALGRPSPWTRGKWSEALVRMVSLCDSTAGGGQGLDIQLVIGLLLEMRNLLSATDWPMPARALPLEGLGTGSLELLSLGAISEGDPNRVASLLIRVQDFIEEAGAHAEVELRVAGRSTTQPVAAVPYGERVDMVLPQGVALESVSLEFSLRLVARDCEQVVARLVSSDSGLEKRAGSRP